MFNTSKHLRIRPKFAEISKSQNTLVKKAEKINSEKARIKQELKEQIVRTYGEQRIQEAIRNLTARKLENEIKFLNDQKYVSKRANDKKLKDEDIDFIIVDNYY